MEAIEEGSDSWKGGVTNHSRMSLQVKSTQMWLNLGKPPLSVLSTKSPIVHEPLKALKSLKAIIDETKTERGEQKMEDKRAEEKKHWHSF